MHHRLLLVSFPGAASKLGKTASRTRLKQCFEFDIAEQETVTDILKAIETNPTETTKPVGRAPRPA
jgi:hypothetical protein